ncbi:hypothetical protein A2U01_0077602, partial [Trifolium medium]|nr:hypothetical protein [Trifolium medium]
VGVEGIEEAVRRFTREEVYSTERIAVESVGVVGQEERWEYAVVYRLPPVE